MQEIFREKEKIMVFSISASRVNELFYFSKNIKYHLEYIKFDVCNAKEAFRLTL